MKMTRTVGGAAALLAAVLLAGCGRSEAEGGQDPAPVEAVEPVENALPAGGISASEAAGFKASEAEVVLTQGAPSRGPSLAGDGQEQWILALEVANTGASPLEGLTYALELVTGGARPKPFAVHAGEIHFTPAIAPEGQGHWSVRVAVREGQPEDAQTVGVRWKSAARASRATTDEVTWKPLDPKNLPPAQKVELDGSGNVASD